MTTVAKEAVYIAVGIREDGSKEVITYSIAPTEPVFIWKELLLEIKERGIERSPTLPFRRLNRNGRHDYMRVFQSTIPNMVSACRLGFNLTYI